MSTDQLGSATSTEVIDVYGAFIYGDSYPLHDFFNYDGIHLNQRGSRTLVMAINNVVEIIKRRRVNEYNNVVENVQRQQLYDGRRQTRNDYRGHISRNHGPDNWSYRRHTRPTTRRHDSDRHDHRHQTTSYPFSGSDNYNNGRQYNSF